MNVAVASWPAPVAISVQTNSHINRRRSSSRGGDGPGRRNWTQRKIFIATALFTKATAYCIAMRMTAGGSIMLRRDRVGERDSGAGFFFFFFFFFKSNTAGREREREREREELVDELHRWRSENMKSSCPQMDWVWLGDVRYDRGGRRNGGRETKRRNVTRGRDMRHPSHYRAGCWPPYGTGISR